MTFTYDAGGAVAIGGCASFDKYVYVEYKWPLNSLLFSKDKARKGIMELVAIKRLFVNNNTKTQRQPVKIYQDTYNGLWNEKDLIEEEEKPKEEKVERKSEESNAKNSERLDEVA